MSTRNALATSWNFGGDSTTLTMAEQTELLALLNLDLPTDGEDARLGLNDNHDTTTMMDFDTTEVFSAADFLATAWPVDGATAVRSLVGIVHLLDDDDDEDREDRKMPATKRQRTANDNDDDLETLARFQQEQEEERKQMEHAAMYQSPSGRAFLLVERMIQEHARIRQEQANLPDFELVGQDDMVFLAERFFQCQLDFRQSGRPTHVSLAYHYTREGHLTSIRQDGLLSHPERKASGLHTKRGAYFGDGIYVGNNPYSFKSMGNTGLLVAILRGYEQRVGRGGTSEPLVDTVIGNKGGRGGRDGGLVTDEIVLKKSCQVLPILRFSGTVVGSSGQIYHGGNALLWQYHVEVHKVVDEFFNQGTPTPLQRITPFSNSDFFAAATVPWPASVSAQQNGFGILVPPHTGTTTASSLFNATSHRINTTTASTTTSALNVASAYGLPPPLPSTAATPHPQYFGPTQPPPPPPAKGPPTPTPLSVIPTSLSGTSGNPTDEWGKEMVRTKHLLRRRDSPAGDHSLVTIGGMPSVAPTNLSQTIVAVPPALPVTNGASADLSGPRACIGSATATLQSETLTYCAPACCLVPAASCTRRVRTLEYSHDCCICFTNLRKKKGMVLELVQCGHLFHEDCITKSLQHGSRCPQCRVLATGKPQGPCPSGTMFISHSDSTCGGYEGSSIGSIAIRYMLPAGTQLAYHETPDRHYTATQRMAYLPNNAEGRNLLVRLKYAWRHGLLFTIGTSLQTGKAGQIVWSSVHQKSSLRGGAHGWPDTNYFANVATELNALGVPSHMEILVGPGPDETITSNGPKA